MEVHSDLQPKHPAAVHQAGLGSQVHGAVGARVGGLEETELLLKDKMALMLSKKRIEKTVLLFAPQTISECER